MSALATVKSGAGLVTVATECENIAALHAHLPEAMAFDCEDEEFLVGKSCQGRCSFDWSWFRGK